MVRAPEYLKTTASVKKQKSTKSESEHKRIIHFDIIRHTICFLLSTMFLVM